MTEISYNYMIFSAAIAFTLTVLLGYPSIPLLRRLKAGQSIREDAPKRHMAKTGTPTMGGLFIAAAVIIAAIFTGGAGREMLVLVFALVGFGAVGFIDDYIKVVRRHNEGLKIKPKMLLLLIIGLALAIAQLKFGTTGTLVWIPFANVDLELHPVVYVIFVVFVVAAMTNAVNFTDGLDGLASGVTLPVAAALGFAAIGSGYGTAGIFAGAVAGGCGGFLVHNHYRAKVFMGDTGSLALGGAITAVAVMTNTIMILPIIGFVYVAEIGSVVIQIIVCRWTRRRGNEKRVFRRTPLHHHFEEKGWSEVLVVLVFSGVSLLLCILGAIIMR